MENLYVIEEIVEKDKEEEKMRRRHKSFNQPARGEGHVV